MKKSFTIIVACAILTLMMSGCTSQRDNSRQSPTTVPVSSNATQAQPANMPPMVQNSSSLAATPMKSASSQSKKPAKSQTKTATLKPGAVCATTATASQSKAIPNVKKSAAANIASKSAEAKSQPQPQKSYGPHPVPKLLDLGATSCIPCRMMASVLDDLSKEYKGKLDVEFIDVWQNQAAAQEYGVQSIPTQIFYDANGHEIYRHVGYFPKEDVIQAFQSHGVNLSK